MKIKEGYLLKEVAGNHIVIPVGNLDFDGMITLNEVGVFIWEKLSNNTNEEEIVALLLKEYEVAPEIAEKDVKAFIQKLRDADLIDE